MKLYRFLFEADKGNGGGSDPPSDPPKQDPPADPPKTEPGPVPYERFKEVNDRLKAANDRLTKIEADQKAAADKQAAEQGEWKELAEQRGVELKTEKLVRTRLEVAAKKGIPPEMAGRLKGETAEEMEADADSLLQFIKPAGGPGVPPAGKGAAAKPLDFSKMSPKEIREATKNKALSDVV